MLLVGVSIGQALPQLQRLVAAETAARTLRGIVTRVSEGSYALPALALGVLAMHLMLWSHLIR